MQKARILALALSQFPSGGVFLGRKDKDQICQIHPCLPRTCLRAVPMVRLDSNLRMPWVLGPTVHKPVK